jgi:bacillolysin
MFYDYFKEKHNWKSYNGADAPLHGYYYDEAVDDASWNENNARFFAGNIKYSPLTSIDVVAHEFGHGIAYSHGILIMEKLGQLMSLLATFGVLV